MVGRKIYIIFVENKENLKIMSRTIEEIQKYFDERPELWAKIDEELAKDMSKGKGMSICEWVRD